ncbi:MAG TPA: diguanylate cyclase [Syntrophomonas sp.]|nr:diguanylate cyclase [Syntrophomonas sp.]
MKVLIADDDKISRLLVKKLLTSIGYEVLEAEDGERAWQILQEEPIRLVVLDWVMPKIEGTELCKRLRASKGEEYYYIIVLTGRNRSEDIIAGLQAGADDYITKPFLPQEFEMRLKIARRILELRQSMQEALEDQRYKGQHDILTGILNREEIINILEKEINRAERQESKLSVIMGDLDNLRQLNNMYGNAAGDEVLIETAQRIKNALRIYDTVGRYGGEEFLLVLPGCSIDEARLIARRILNVIKNEPVLYHNNEISATISLGLAGNDSVDHSDLKGIIQAADFAMRQAKEKGRNRYEVADD